MGKPPAVSAKAALFFIITFIEFFNPSGGVDEYLLPGIKRVRCRTYLDLDDWIGLSVLPFDGLF